MNVSLRLAILQSSIRSQVRLAAATAIREDRLSRIVNGWVIARREEREAIATALGKPVAELFTRDAGAGMNAA